jgi:hypothetical protein
MFAFGVRGKYEHYLSGDLGHGIWAGLFHEGASD